MIAHGVWFCEITYQTKPQDKKGSIHITHIKFNTVRVEDIKLGWSLLSSFDHDVVQYTEIRIENICAKGNSWIEKDLEKAINRTFCLSKLNTEVLDNII